MQCHAEGMVHHNDKLDEVLAALENLLVTADSTRLGVFSTSPSPVSGTISLPCITVMDAMGREHKIPLEFSFSYNVRGLPALY